MLPWITVICPDCHVPFQILPTQVKRLIKCADCRPRRRNPPVRRKRD